MIIHVFTNGRKISVKGDCLSVCTEESNGHLRIKQRRTDSKFDATIAIFQSWDCVVNDENLAGAETTGPDEVIEGPPEEGRPSRRLNIPDDE